MCLMQRQLLPGSVLVVQASDSQPAGAELTRSSVCSGPTSCIVEGPIKSGSVWEA